MGQNPNYVLEADREILDFARQANLDAFWSREVSTVKHNLGEGRRLERFVKRLNMPPATPPMGPFPLLDMGGMQVAMCILDRPLAPGKTERFVQYDTFWKSRSVLTNISQAGVSGLRDSVGAYERNKIWISKVATHSFWFSKFMEGIHRRVGEDKRQDQPMTIEVLHEIDAILEGE